MPCPSSLLLAGSDWPACSAWFDEAHSSAQTRHIVVGAFRACRILMVGPEPKTNKRACVCVCAGGAMPSSTWGLTLHASYWLGL
jgi:hypothetical protein